MFEEQIDVVTEEVSDLAVENQKQFGNNPVAEASLAMPGMLAYFKDLVENQMGGVHAKKVLLALSESPFAEVPPHFTTQAQYEAFNLGIQIFNSKFMILMASLRDANKTKPTEEHTQESKEIKDDQTF